MTRQKMINALHFASFVLLPLASWPLGKSFHLMLSKQIVLYTIGVLTLMLWITGSFRIPKEERSASENRLLLLYSLFLIASIAVAQDKTVAFLGSAARRDGVLMFFNYIAVYFLARRSTLDEQIVFKGLCVSACLISILALLQSYQIDPPFLRLYSESWKGKAFSLMGNPNFLGTFLVLMIPLGLYFALEKKKWWGLAVYSLVFLALLATRTRGSWIGAFVAFFAYFFLTREKFGKTPGFYKKWMALCLLSVILLVFFIFTATFDFENRLFSIFSEGFDVVTGAEGAESAGSSRVYIWNKVIGLIKERPLLGYGVENLSYAMHNAYHDVIVKDYGEYRNWDKAHNEYLHIAVSSGIPSLIVYLGFLVAALRKGFVNRHATSYHALLLSALIGYLVQATFNIQMLLVYYLFLGYLALASREPRTVEDSGETTRV
jgi:O-antigen ligase